MHNHFIFWIIFSFIIIVMVYVDLTLTDRRSGKVSIKSSLLWSGIWIGAALSFNLLILFFLENGSQSSHRNSTKTLGNWAFLTFLCALGLDEPLFLAMQFKIANKINVFNPVSHGMAVHFFKITAQLRRSGSARSDPQIGWLAH